MPKSSIAVFWGSSLSRLAALPRTRGIRGGLRRDRCRFVCLILWCIRCASSFGRSCVSPSCRYNGGRWLKLVVFIFHSWLFVQVHCNTVSFNNGGFFLHLKRVFNRFAWLNQMRLPVPLDGFPLSGCELCPEAQMKYQ